MQIEFDNYGRVKSVKKGFISQFFEDFEETDTTYIVTDILGRKRSYPKSLGLQFGMLGEMQPESRVNQRNQRNLGDYEKKTTPVRSTNSNTNDEAIKYLTVALAIVFLFLLLIANPVGFLIIMLVAGVLIFCMKYDLSRILK